MYNAYIVIIHMDYNYIIGFELPWDNENTIILHSVIDTLMYYTIMS